jgi:hypothetical protein
LSWPHRIIHADESAVNRAANVGLTPQNGPEPLHTERVCEDTGPSSSFDVGSLHYGLAAQFQVPHLEGESGSPWALTHWLLSHTRPVEADVGTAGSGVAAE